jgi:hypothetical protein
VVPIDPPPPPPPVDVNPPDGYVEPEPGPEPASEPGESPVIAMPKPGASIDPIVDPVGVPVAPPEPTVGGPTLGGGTSTPVNGTVPNTTPVQTTQPGMTNTPASPDASNREPYLYPGLHVSPEQSPHYAIALAYGREHGYNDDEIMKLAVLMQSNRDMHYGRAWLDLQPPVLLAAVNAVVRNPDNSFDISGVFGGRRGYSDVPANQRVYVNSNNGYAMDTNGVVVGNGPYIAPPGWVLDREEIVSSEGGTLVQEYYRPGDDLLALNDVYYLPLHLSGYVQVRHGAESTLSVGADGGYHDLSRFEFHPEYGLVTTPDNYRPFDNSDWTDTVLPALIFTAVGAGLGVLAGVGTLGATAIGAFTGTLGVTLDPRSALRAGVISFVSGGFAQWLTPYLLQGVTVTDVVRQGVQGLLTSLTAGVLQGDARQGLINGVASFISVQIAQLTGLPRPLAGAIIRGLHDPNGALQTLISDLVVGAVTEGAQGIVAENAVVSRLQQQYPDLTDEQARQVARTLLNTGREIGDVNSGRVGTGGANRLNGTNAQQSAEIDAAALRYRIAVDDGDMPTQIASLNRLLSVAQQQDPGGSVEAALNRALATLGIPALPPRLALEDGRVVSSRQGNVIVGDPRVVNNPTGPANPYFLGYGPDGKPLYADTSLGVVPNGVIRLTHFELNDVPSAPVGSRLGYDSSGTPFAGVVNSNGVFTWYALSAADRANFPTQNELALDEVLRGAGAAVRDLPNVIGNMWDIGVDAARLVTNPVGAVTRPLSPATQRLGDITFNDLLHGAFTMTPAGWIVQAASGDYRGAGASILMTGVTGIAGMVGGSVARLTLAEARVAFREVMAVNPATAYSNAHVAVVLEGGRVLIRNGLDFYEGLFVNNGSRFIMSPKPVNSLLDEAALARLANREQLTAAEAARVTSALNANGTTLSNAVIYENRIAASFTQINRAIEQLGPQRFQQLTERYVELVRSN